MSRNVLFIAYYLPPMGGSGVQRPLKFIRYLSRYNWHPIILAPEPGAYHTFDESLTEELDRCEATIYRVEAETPFHKWSSAASLVDKLPERWKRWLRTLSYGFMLPDNKKGWIEPAVRKAQQILQDHTIEIIFSTAPPYSNHIIASRIGQENDLPVVMDLRDDWLESQLIEYPTRWHKRRMAQLEEETLKRADLLTVLDPFMKKRLGDRYQKQLPPTEIVAHGYDPADFNRENSSTLKYKNSKLNLLHSGTFNHKNQPDPLLHALGRAFKREPALEEDLVLHFQGGLANNHRELINKLDLAQNVFDYGYLPHRTAVANLQSADVLWVISDYGPKHQQSTSGKLYEYLGSGKPILGLVYPDGEEERLLNRYGGSYLAQPDHYEEIVQVLLQLYEDWKAGRLPEPDMEWVKRFDRRRLTGELAHFFDQYRKSQNKIEIA